MKDNLQNPNITDVYVYTMDDFVVPWMSVKDGKHDAFIHVVGQKNLHLVGDATIRVQENPNEDYIEFSSLIHVPANASLTIDGDGCINFHARWKNLINAVINNEGNLTITGNGKISFTDTGAGDPSFGWGSSSVCTSVS